MPRQVIVNLRLSVEVGEAIERATVPRFAAGVSLKASTALVVQAGPSCVGGGSPYGSVVE